MCKILISSWFKEINDSLGDDLRIDNFKSYNTYIINNEEYQKSRDERIDFLLKCDVSKETLEDGSLTVKGTREFLKTITERLNGNTVNTKEGTVNKDTGELLDEDGVTPLSEIIG